MIFRVFNFTFCSETAMKENNWMGTTFVALMIIARSQVLSQGLRSTLRTAFERHFTIEDSTDMDQHKCRACNKTFDLLLYALNKPSFKI